MGKHLLTAAAWALIVVGCSTKDAPPKPIAETPSSSNATPTLQRERSSSAIDPQEFLVLVGIGDLKSDNRPHVMGVGWLWDRNTTVVPRRLGDALAELVVATQQDGAPRQACVIQGVAIEVAEIKRPVGCPEISVLRLKEPAELPVAAAMQWQRVAEADVERLRLRGKSLRYVSFAPLPRPVGTGNHGFSFVAYDPELIHLSGEEARLLYEQKRHMLKPPDDGGRLERGGLLVDSDQKIVGMTLADSSIVWTAALEGALATSRTAESVPTKIAESLSPRPAPVPVAPPASNPADNRDEQPNWKVGSTWIGLGTYTKGPDFGKAYSRVVLRILTRNGPEFMAKWEYSVHHEQGLFIGALDVFGRIDGEFVEWKNSFAAKGQLLDGALVLTWENPPHSGENVFVPEAIFNDRKQLASRYRISAEGKFVFDLTLADDGTATKSLAPKVAGAWQPLKGGALVVWSEGWRDVLTVESGHLVKQAFEPGTSVVGKPVNRGIAAKVTGK